MENLIKEVSDLVSKEIVLVFSDDDECGEIPNDESHDSFGEIWLRGRCEPEDAIWRRDLQDNYCTGLKVGIRNTLKVLKDNPELLKQL